MESHKNSLISSESGFGLVEIMVGMAIGLITTLVIVQVVTSFEAQKRTTANSADAQVNGSIALYTLQRAIQKAGYGMPIFASQDVGHQPLECALPQTYGTSAIGIVPVTLTDGGGGVSDTITVRSGDPATGGVPLTVKSVAGLTVTVDNNLGCTAPSAGPPAVLGDISFIVDGATCSMSKVTAVSAAGVSPATVTLLAAPATGSGVLSCITNWHEDVYAVNNGNLTTNGNPSLSGIVNIQAQYGISNLAGSTQVTSWVNPTAGSAWETTATSPTIADRKRIQAIRIAIVSRSGLLEKTNVTNACSSLILPAPTGLCAWEGTSANPAPQIDLSADPNWQQYRYRVFETVIPLRNMIWSFGNLK